MSYKDYYTILGVGRDATQDEIQRAYRKLARKYHPDVNKEAGSETRFKEIGEAYGVLKDEKKRSLYDRYGDAWKAVSDGNVPPPDPERVRVDFQSAGFDPGQLDDLGSIFETIFGAHFGGRQAAGRQGGFHGAWPVSGSDHEASLSLTLDEAYTGGRRDVHLVDRETGHKRQYSVTIPPGVQPGQRIRLAGQGGRGAAGGPDGHLYLRVELAPHPRFRLEGNDLYATLPVTPWEASLGAEIETPTIDGTVRVRVPAGSSSGRKIRLKGKGYRRPRGGRGDLYLELRIVVPAALSSEEKALMTRLSEVSSFNPRKNTRKAS